MISHLQLGLLLNMKVDQSLNLAHFCPQLRYAGFRFVTPGLSFWMLLVDEMLLTVFTVRSGTGS